MNKELNFYSILDRVSDAGVKLECGYVEEGQNSMPAVIADDEVTFHENIDEARNAFWSA